MEERRLKFILFARESYPTFRVDIVKLFAHEMASRGHYIEFVMQSGSGEKKDTTTNWNGSKVWLGPTRQSRGLWGRAQRFWLGFWHDVRILSAINLRSYDFVQVRNKFVSASVALFLAKRSGVKFIYWLSFPFPEEQFLSARSGTAKFPLVNFLRGFVFSFLLYRYILPNCDHAFVQSDQMRRDINAFGIPLEKMTAVPMGIDPEDFRLSDDAKLTATASHRVSDESFVIGYLGTLDVQRRLTVLIEMLSLVVKRGIDASLLIVGDSAHERDRHILEDLAKTLGVADRMRITGFLPRDDALRTLRIADVGISPFFPTPILRSTSPTKLVEYMAMGLPIIGNRHPEQYCIIRESRAGLCVPWGSRHFARACTWLAARTESERIELGRRGQQWVARNRTYTKIANDLEHKYLQLIQSA